MVIEPLPGANAADFLDFFDNRAFSDGSPYAPCYCNCFHLTADEICGGILARADALGGGFDGMKGALRESAAELIGKGVLRGYMAYENGVVVAGATPMNSRIISVQVHLIRSARGRKIITFLRANGGR